MVKNPVQTASSIQYVANLYLSLPHVATLFPQNMMDLMDVVVITDVFPPRA